MVSTKTGKPLPSIPLYPTAGTSRLSVAASTHLTEFIRHALSENPNATNETEVWVTCFERVLDKFTESVVGGDWLNGLRRKRERPKDIPSRGNKAAQLSALLSRQTTSTDSVTPKHLLLCIAPHSSESGSTVGCAFRPHSFAMSETGENVLYGLHEWEGETTDDNSPRVVGGTFTLTGPISPSQHTALSNVLRLALYVHLSLVLEQSFLENSHVKLVFPELPPSPPPTIVSPAATIDFPQREPDTPHSKGFRKNISSGIFSFFSKRKDKSTPSIHLLNDTRAGSLDKHRPEPFSFSHNSEEDLGDHARIRRFSFMSDTRQSLVKTLTSPLSPLHVSSASSSSETSQPEITQTTAAAELTAHHHQFTTAITMLAESSHLLSTSPGVAFAPPYLISSLAEKERVQIEKAKKADEEKEKRVSLFGLENTEQNARNLNSSHPGKLFITGDERVGLSSVIGWGTEGTKENATKGMKGTSGFVRMQGLSLLYSEYVAGQDFVPEPVGSESPGKIGSNISSEALSSSMYEVSSSTLSASTTSTASSASNASLASMDTGNSTTTTRTVKPPSATYQRCDKPTWVTYRYYNYARPQDVSSPISEEGEEIVNDLAEAVQPTTENDAGTHETPTSTTSGTETPTVTDKVPVHTEATSGFSRDMPLGTFLLETSAMAKENCRIKTCRYLKGEHDKRWVHGGISVNLTFEEGKEAESGSQLVDGVLSSSQDEDDEKTIMMWSSCAICDAETEHVKMKDATFLLSFAKFLEVLIYSPAVCDITPTLCPHTSTSHAKDASSSTVTSTNSKASTQSSLPESRLNIVRHFGVSSGAPQVQNIITFVLSTVRDVFELRVPRLQITRHGDKAAAARAANDHLFMDPQSEEDKRILRREIMAWWQGLFEHVDKLAELLTENAGVLKKNLPQVEGEEFEDPPKTHTKLLEPPPTPTRMIPGSPGIPGLPPLPPSPYSGIGSLRDYFGQPSSGLPSSSNTSGSVTPTATESNANLTRTAPTELLMNMRNAFQRAEQALHTQLSETPVSLLNDVRREFVSAARGASRRLLAWQAKHLKNDSTTVSSTLTKIMAQEPEWWARGCHAVPGGNIVVREDDYGSVIAFVLGTADYARELANLSSTVRPLSAASATSLQSPTSLGKESEASTTPVASAPSGSSFFALFGSAQANPDPDEEDVVWNEPEVYSASIVRKDNPRELSIRHVLKSPIDGVHGLPIPRFRGSLGSSSGRSMAGSPAPPTAWSKADVQLSMEAADGEVVARTSGAGKMLHDIDQSASWTEIEHPGHSSVGSYERSDNVETHIRRGEASSLLSDSGESLAANETISPIPKSAEPTPSLMLLFPPPVPPKDEEPSLEPEETVTTPTRWNTHPEESQTPRPLSPTSSFFNSNSITTSISHAMRFMLNNGELPRSSSPVPKKNHHALLFNADLATIDEKPHIKYDWTVGKRLKFSCTVYYAKQFDSLRRRCGIDDIFLKSLARSTNWAAQGGKSKSNFWKTSDDRYIIKTLVNAWNVADLQVLLDLAPSYFRHMDSTTSKATALAKLIGFYTIEIKNVETGTIQTKLDLLVMENLFHGQKIAKTFDLKGIQGRKVKPSKTGDTAAKTLFDGEWIEGQQKTLTLIRPHSKAVLREAIKSDAEFLAKSNIMDYSLLVGVDEDQKHIACGLVDTIGSYTFAKTLEYKAKHNLNSSGKDVTVIPPAEYQRRFVSALDGYFVACPDKWSKPMDDIKIPSDISDLPSVL